MTPIKTKVTIVGAGIPGMTLALILADENIDVTVVDRHPLPKKNKKNSNARTTALMQGSLNILKRAGVWPEFKSSCAPLKQLSIVDDSAYPRGIESMVREDFRAEELGLDSFGHNVPLTPMGAFMADKIRAHKSIKIMEGVTIAHDDEAIKNADLIVGADGRSSVVRGWAGINAVEKQYGQRAITCMISHTQSHDDTSIEFHRSGGPCTFVPCGDNQSAIVWVEKSDDVDAFLKLPKKSFIQALQDRSRGTLGQIDLMIEPESWPLMTLKANRLVAPKIALMAEAAHVLSPIGAQGLNLSLRDVNDLADVIINAVHNGDDVGSLAVLKIYEKKRMADMIPRLYGVDWLNQFVANDNKFIASLRRLGLRTIKHGGRLRRFVMKQGLAPKS